MTDDPYIQAHIDTQREALAIAIHAARGDTEFVALTFNGAEHPELLVHMLARLPYLLVSGLVSAHGPEGFDFAKQCEEMLRGLPGSVEDVDKLIDGEQRYADEEEDK